MEIESGKDGVENPIAGEHPMHGEAAPASGTAGSALEVAVDMATDRSSSWHQATIQVFLDASQRGTATKMYVVAFIIVLGKYLVSVSIVVSTFNRPCMSNDGCSDGQF